MPPKSAKPRRQPRLNPVSESSEDHLERIHELMEEKGYARVSDIAERLGIARPSVTNMVQRLATRGLVNYERYRGLTLTEQGRAVARSIKARHQVLTEFFELLGLEPKLIADEVEGIEHHLKPPTLDALAALSAYWRAHGAEHAKLLKAVKLDAASGKIPT